MAPQAVTAKESSLLVVHPYWLIAIGDSEELTVRRSPLVFEDDEDMEPVNRFIEDHGLVLATQQTIEDDNWMYACYEFSLYATAVRNNCTPELALAGVS